MPMQPPNILLIITDHQAFFGHHRPGEFEYVWPRYEQFCAAGIRFNRAYSVAPVCTPARSSLMTGEYPSQHRLMWNSDSGGEFKPNQRLYHQYLAEAGYRNAYIGKWHCSHIRQPADYGFEGWSLPDYGKVYMSEAYKQYAAARGFGEARALIEHQLDFPEMCGRSVTLHAESPFHFMGGSGVLQGPAAAHEEQFTAHLVKNQLQKLTKGTQPWNLVASFWGPHNPYFPTEPFASMFDPKTIPEYPTFRDDLAGRPLRYFLHREFHHAGVRRWRGDWSIWQEILARAYGQGLQTDAAIGEILDALDESGAADNTIVIWCADHGDAIACHGGLWDKASTYIEEVARVPLAVRWPARFAGGRVTDELVSNLDVTATMLAAAGLSVPAAMASRSLLPLCTGPATDWPKELICEHAGHGEDFPQRIIIEGRFEYVAALFDGDEMYDLKADPYQCRNLIHEPAYRDIKAHLQQRIIQHIERTRDDIAAPLAFKLKQGF